MEDALNGLFKKKNSINLNPIKKCGGSHRWMDWWACRRAWISCFQCKTDVECRSIHYLCMDAVGLSLDKRLPVQTCMRAAIVAVACGLPTSECRHSAFC